MGRFLPTIKRFFEGTAGVVAGPRGDARGHLSRADFMTSDLTGAAGYISR
jgi:hypothetical protein